MSMRILSITLLLLSVCLCFQSSAGNRRHPTKHIVPLCCTAVSSVDISARITGTHTIQRAKGQCVDAIIFPINNGKVCVDPKSKWVQELIGE